MISEWYHPSWLVLSLFRCPSSKKKKKFETPISHLYLSCRPSRPLLQSFVHCRLPLSVVDRCYPRLPFCPVTTPLELPSQDWIVPDVSRLTSQRHIVKRHLSSLWSSTHVHLPAAVEACLATFQPSCATQNSLSSHLLKSILSLSNSAQSYSTQGYCVSLFKGFMCIGFIFLVILHLVSHYLV